MADAITLEALINRLGNSSQEEAYDWLGFDYSKLSSSVDSAPGLVHQIAWTTAPSREHVLRLLNQINTFYAERWALDCPTVDPTVLLLDLNRITLHRQGKHLGFRERGIEFGIRVHLDVLDHWRRWRWLRGAHTAFVAEMVEDWKSAIAIAPRSVDSALALAMTVIAVHPFSDANGRVGRLVFSWLCRRWNLGHLSLDEGEDGELLRTGSGLESTEYLMAMFMIRLMGGHNVVEPGTGGHQDLLSGQLMRDAMRTNLAHMTCADSLLASSEFIALRKHWTEHNHLRSTTPRFKCLRSLVR